MDCTTKVCVDCGLEKSMDDFGPSTRSRDHKRTYCKPCGIKRREPGWSQDGEKLCCRCRRSLPLDQFTRMRAGKDGRAAYCKHCHREANNLYYHDNPEYRRRVKVAAIAAHYGITPDAYVALEEEQGGLCAICGGEPTAKGLHVDHAHDASGLVRGLLCSRCNVGLGMLLDSPDLLRHAIAYLDWWAQITVSTAS